MLVNYVFWHWDNKIGSDFCKSVISEINWEADSMRATISFMGRVDQETRKSDVVFCSPDVAIGITLQNLMQEANVLAGWNFHLDYVENIQIARYMNNEYYDWHIDTDLPINGRQRKLTGVILLNDSSEFEGGELQIKVAKENNPLRTVGSVIVFPSYLKHRVAPVTKGVRYSATCWLAGPPFR